MSEMPDWEARFRARRLGLPDFARDDARCTVVPATTAAGTLELHWWTVGDDEPVPATDRPEGTAHGTLDPSGRSLWWFDDRKGDEKGVWQRQDYGSVPGSHTDATGLPHAYSSGLALGDELAVVGSSDDDYGVRVHVVRRGRPTRVLYAHDEDAYVSDLSEDETLLAISHSEHGDSRHPACGCVRVADGSDGRPSCATAPARASGPVGVLPRRRRPAAAAAARAPRPAELLIWDVDADTETRDRPRPAGRGRRRLVARRRRVAARAGTPRARTRLYRYDLRRHRSTRSPTSGAGRVGSARSGRTARSSTPGPPRPPAAERAPLHPDGTAACSSPRPAGSAAVGARRGRLGGRPGRADPRAGRRAGRRRAPCPRCSSVHGGPTLPRRGRASRRTRAPGSTTASPSSRVNYRGSTGYGVGLARRDRGAGSGSSSWRTSRRCATGGRRRASPTRRGSCSTGGSWGGYLTLLGAGHAAGARGRWASAGVPVADYVTAYEDEMEALQGVRPVAVRRLAGGGARAVRRRRRPITYVDAVRAPVLVLAGRERPALPDPADRQLPGPAGARAASTHEVYRYDAGHGSLVVEERIRQMRVELDFAAGAPGGMR